MEDSCLGPLTANPVEYYRKKWLRIVDITGFRLEGHQRLGHKLATDNMVHSQHQMFLLVSWKVVLHRHHVLPSCNSCLYNRQFSNNKFNMLRTNKPKIFTNTNIIKY